VTPPDVISQLALAIPMCILYELGIIAAQVFIKHTQAPDAAASDSAEPAMSGASHPDLTASAAVRATASAPTRRARARALRHLDVSSSLLRRAAPPGPPRWWACSAPPH
jgi:hypothetical protein